MLLKVNDFFLGVFCSVIFVGDQFSFRSLMNAVVNLSEACVTTFIFSLFVGFRIYSSSNYSLHSVSFIFFLFYVIMRLKVDVVNLPT